MFAHLRRCSKRQRSDISMVSKHFENNRAETAKSECIYVKIARRMGGEEVAKSIKFSRHRDKKRLSLSLRLDAVCVCAGCTLSLFSPGSSSTPSTRLTHFVPSVSLSLSVCFKNVFCARNQSLYFIYSDFSISEGERGAEREVSRVVKTFYCNWKYAESLKVCSGAAEKNVFFCRARDRELWYTFYSFSSSLMCSLLSALRCAKRKFNVRRSIPV